MHWRIARSLDVYPWPVSDVSLDAWCQGAKNPPVRDLTPGSSQST